MVKPGTGPGTQGLETSRTFGQSSIFSGERGGARGRGTAPGCPFLIPRSPASA